MNGRMKNDALFEALTRERAAESAKREKEQADRDQRRALFRAIEEAANFKGPEDLVAFANLWAHKWWEVGKALHSSTKFQVSELPIPLLTEYRVAANLLEQAMQGSDFTLFKADLSKALVHLGQDGRIWAARRIFDHLEDHLRGRQSTTSLALQIDSLRLDPSDKEILNHLLKQKGKRRLTSEIAASMHRGDKAVAKNLSKLVRDGLLENLRRQGYQLTAKGEQVALTISQLSPKPRA